MSNLKERAALTEKEIRKLYDATRDGICTNTKPSVNTIRGLTDAATEKAVKVVLEELEPLVRAGNALARAMEMGMNSIVSDAWYITLAHYADLRAEMT